MYNWEKIPIGDLFLYRKRIFAKYQMHSWKLYFYNSIV
jgi:hypothetical protein